MLLSKHTTKGRLIIFEGIDGTGKTTLSKYLVQQIRAQGQSCIWASFPGNEPNTLGKKIYALHHSPRKIAIPAISLQLLHVAAHIESIQHRIFPALNSGTWVVLDRFWWSTWVYGITAMANASELNFALKIEKLQWGNIKPSLAFLLFRKKINKKSLENKQKINKFYMEIVKKENKTCPILKIKNDGSLESVNQEIFANVSPLLQEIK